jgi:integrase
MISLAYHHGLRVSELVSLRWSDVDFKAGDVAVNRREKGAPIVNRSILATSAISRPSTAIVSRMSGSLRRSAARPWRRIALPAS